MALTASGVTTGRGVIDRTNISVCGIVNSVVRSAQHVELQVKCRRVELQRESIRPSNCSKVNKIGTRQSNVKHGSSKLCCSARMPDTKTEESVCHHNDSQYICR